MIRRFFKNMLKKNENVSESTDAEVSVEKCEPVFNKKLFDHFSKLPLKQYAPNKLYHGGAHIPGVTLKGTLWMHDNRQEAQHYASFGKPVNPSSKMVVLEAEPVKPLRLIEFGGNHIDILKNIYEGSWNHQQFHKDFCDLKEMGKLDCDGFYRPRTDEYFILDIENNLRFI